MNKSKCSDCHKIKKSEKNFRARIEKTLNKLRKDLNTIKRMYDKCLDIYVDRLNTHQEAIKLLEQQYQLLIDSIPEMKIEAVSIDERDYRIKAFVDNLERKKNISKKEKEVKRKAGRKKHYQKAREKRWAYAKLHAYIKTNKTEKPTVCECCGCKGKLEAHHWDHSHPLNVRWLLPKCHTELHKWARQYKRLYDLL